MAGISKLPEELGLEILAWLSADHDALFSLYNTSFTFRSCVVFYLLKRAPALLISWAAMNGDFKSLQKVVDQYPEATINGSGERLSGLCPPYALVIAARRGHAEVLEIILTLETTHKAEEA
jgi:alpha/beta superfamily hydrolase